MSTIQISLPDDVKAIVDQRIANGDDADLSAYFCRLIVDDQRRNAQNLMEAELVTRIEDPRAVEMDDADWGKIRAAVSRRVVSRGRP